MDTAFGFSIVLRFILPGAVCGIAILLISDTASFYLRNESIFRALGVSDFAISAAAVLIPVSFACGVILNALTFQRGYMILNSVYSRKNPNSLKIESVIYGAHVDSLVSKIDGMLSITASDSLRRLLWKNKRGILLATFDREALENLDEKYSPYIDFQLGLAISIGIVALTLPTWFIYAKYGVFSGLNIVAMIAISEIFAMALVAVLLNSVYINYEKLREMRLVMVSTFGGRLHDQ